MECLHRMVLEPVSSDPSSYRTLQTRNTSPCSHQILSSLCATKMVL